MLLTTASNICAHLAATSSKEKKKLKFSMLYTVDGNDSLKRILQREDAPEQQEAQEPAMAEPTPATAAEPTAAQAPMIMEGPRRGPSSEVKDLQTAGCSIYLTREQVDEWAKEVLMEDMPGFDYDNDNPCDKCWWNMENELTSKMWGVFEESGLFLALFRHGFVLLLVDMVWSGEL